MKIQFKALTEETAEIMKKYAETNKEVKIISISPVILEEEFKDKHLDYMLKNIAKTLKVSELVITKNKIYINSLQKEFRKKASKKLNVPKESIQVKVL